VAESGTRSIVADVRAGVLFAHSGLRASVFAVRSNVKRIEDQSFVERINRRTDTIEETAEQTAQRVTADLERRNQPG